MDGTSAAATRRAVRFSTGGGSAGVGCAFNATDAISIRSPSSRFGARRHHLPRQRRGARRLDSETLDLAAVGRVQRAPLDQTTRALLDLREKCLELPVDLDREPAGGGKRLDAAHVLGENLQFKLLIGERLRTVRVPPFDQGAQTL